MESNQNVKSESRHPVPPVQAPAPVTIAPQPPVQPEPMIEEPVQLNKWKWITLDPELFPTVSVPCLLRNDEALYYIPVRVIEKIILSHFENEYSQEARDFGQLSSFPCTFEEMNLLNDINDNHVDKLFGHEKFNESDIVVRLEQFLEFFKILKRTVALKPTLAHTRNVVQLQPSSYYQANKPLINNSSSTHFNSPYVQNVQPQQQSAYQQLPNIQSLQNRPYMNYQPPQSYQIRHPINTYQYDVNNYSNYYVRPHLTTSTPQQQFQTMTNNLQLNYQQNVYQNYQNLRRPQTLIQVNNYPQNNAFIRPTAASPNLPNLRPSYPQQQVTQRPALTQVNGTSPPIQLLTQMTQLLQPAPVRPASPVQVSTPLTIASNPPSSNPSPPLTLPILAELNQSSDSKNFTQEMIGLNQENNHANKDDDDDIIILGDDDDEPIQPSAKKTAPQSQAQSSVQESSTSSTTVQQARVQPETAQTAQTAVQQLTPQTLDTTPVQTSISQTNVRQVQPIILSSKSKTQLDSSQIVIDSLKQTPSVALLVPPQIHSFRVITERASLPVAAAPIVSMQSRRSSDSVCIPDKYGLVQLNSFTFPFVRLEDHFYQYNKKFPNCNKYVCSKHLIEAGLITQHDVKRNLTIKSLDKHEIKHMNSLITKHRLNFNQFDSSQCNQVELVNVIEFQFVYAKQAYFFKVLDENSQFEQYESVLKSRGGLLLIKKIKKVIPFIQLENKLLVGDSLKYFLKEYGSISVDNERVFYDASQQTVIREFYQLILFYFSLDNKINNDSNYINLEKWLDKYSDDFAIICEYNENFPSEWRDDLDNYLRYLNNQKSSATSAQIESASLTPQSIVSSEADALEQEHAPIKIISCSILNKHADDTAAKQRANILIKRKRRFSDAVLFEKKENIKYRNLRQKLKGQPPIREHPTLKRSFSASHLATPETEFSSKQYIKKILVKQEPKTNYSADHSEAEAMSKKTPLKTKRPDTVPIQEELKQSPKTPVKDLKYKDVMPSTSKSLESNKLFNNSAKKSTSPKKRVSSQDSPFSCNKIMKRKNSNLKQRSSSSKRQKLFSRFQDDTETEYTDETSNDFIVSNNTIEKLTKDDEPFNFEHKIVEPKNLEVLKTKLDLYTSDEFDEKQYLKKFKIANCKVVIEHFDMSEHLKKVQERGKQSKPVKAKGRKCQTKKSLIDSDEELVDLDMAYVHAKQKPVRGKRGTKAKNRKTPKSYIME